jgi:hypothetical protein
MKPFDDSLSEENTPPYQDLTTLLRQITPIVAVTAEEQSQMLARVRTRLHQTDDVSSEDTSSTSENSEGVLQSSLLRRKVPRRRLSRMRYTLNMIAAVLVVGVLAGASLWLFSSQRTNGLVMSIPTGAPVGSIKAPVTVRSEAGGLEASLQVTSGPYFLSELLDVTATLTNHNNKSIFLKGGVGTLNFCTVGALTLITRGGGPPFDNLPSNNTPTMTCSSTQMELTPGKTLIMQGYVPLIKSGQVALTLEANFLNITKDRYGDEETTSGTDPLYQHWPVLHMNVAAKIPSDRILLLQKQDSQVIINAPVTVQSHLVDYQAMSCMEDSSNKGSIADVGWSPLFPSTLTEPECWGSNKHWTYVVGAPGYAIVVGEISS